jgi:hypothetical protein
MLMTITNIENMCDSAPSSYVEKNIKAVIVAIAFV